MQSLLLRTMSLVALILLAGCGGPDPPAASSSQAASTVPAEVPALAESPNEAATSSPSSTGGGVEQVAASTATGAAQSSVAGLRDKLKIKHGDGKTAFSIKPKEDGAKLVDAAEKEVARYNASPGKFKIKDGDDKELGYVVGTGQRWKLEKPDQTTREYQLQRQSDGDWKLEDHNETLIYKIKKREYGYEIEDGNETSLYKVKVKGEKTSLRNSRDETVLYTKDPISPMAMACLGMDAIGTVAKRVGLLVAIQSSEEE